jgi:hypothetical protein
MLKPKNVIDVIDFSIFHNLFVAYFLHIQQISPHWKHSIHIMLNKTNAIPFP